MSSDGYFDDDELDAAALEELDAIESALLSPKEPPTQRNNGPQKSNTSAKSDGSLYDISLDIDENELQRLDGFIADAYAGKTQPVAGPSRISSQASVQTTLLGDHILKNTQSSRKERHKSRLTTSSRNLFGQQAPKTKVWDHTEFAKTGLKGRKSKGKHKTTDFDENEQEEEAVEFEQFPAPFVSGARLLINRPPPPMKLAADLLEAKHWIYPLNQPKRDYQYNIVKHCLFDNTLVALPTGLGKTFIAGVVMLNFYRWFPEGKVVFVAPTKPLVAQQIEACHRTCGIPGHDAAELTGQVPRALRARAWQEKRVFYMTPQTFVNDLVTVTCDPRDIILLVVDEAHKATGGYAYNQVVRFLMAKNPHFRILALTATPGSTPEAVQVLIDGLHLSRIEIRNENSLDIKPYIHEKTVKQHVIKMTADVDRIKQLLIKLMDAEMKPLKQRGILWNNINTENLHPYLPQARMGSLTREQGWAFGPLSRLSSLARAMGYLVEGTMGMCYTYMQELNHGNHGKEEESKSQWKKKRLADDPGFQEIIQELDTQRNQGFSPHPKMERLKALIIQYFGEQLDDKEGASDRDSRAMVFVTFRDIVDEIVETLNAEKPLLRASRFIGQGIDKQGRKGLAQKEQLDVIKKFQAGEFNVLVATSIGEEGLDIGEVDLIICYDAQKTPIRMLQRLGRTGRKRAGFVHVLLAEGREEFNLDKAKVTYKEVQKTIVRGDQLELYADVEKLLPEHIKPECLEKQMEIIEYTREESRSRSPSKSSAKGTKRKRNDDVLRNIPAGAHTGFVSVAELLVKGAKKRKVVSLQNFEEAGEDDDTDRDIESGIVMASPRRTKSESAASIKRKTKMRRNQTAAGAASIGKKKKSRTPTPRQFLDEARDDDTDRDIEQGLIHPFPGQQLHHTGHDRQITPDSTPVPPTRSSPKRAVIEVPDTTPGPSSRDRSKSLSHVGKRADEQDISWLLDGDEDPSIEIVDNSPMIERRSYSVANGDIESVEEGSPSSVTRLRTISPWPSQLRFKSQESTGDDYTSSVSLSHINSATARVPNPGRRAGQLDHSPYPEPSFPVRPLQRRSTKPLVIHSSPREDAGSPSSNRRIHRRKDASSETTISRDFRQPNPIKSKFKPVYDLVAEHSGDETSEGSSGSEEVESESDRRFLEDLPETQVSPSYDQSLIYRQSLFTQAPMGSMAPKFALHPVRPGRFGNRSPTHHPLPISSSPSRGDEPDEYAFGSFVVDDEEDISYLSSDEQFNF